MTTIRPSPPLPTSIAKIVALAMTAALGAGCIHRIGERELLEAGRPPGQTIPRAASLEVPTDDGTVLRGFLFQDAGSHFVVIYFGGNGEWIMPNSWIGPHGKRHGFDAYAMNYRGYGPSDGAASLDTIQPDALRIFDALAARPEVAGRPIVLYGVSLGAAMALHVAANRKVDGVVLQAPPSDMARNAPKARRALPWYVRPFVRLRAAPELANRKPQPIDDARLVTAPLLVLHGTDDRVIAFRFGEEIYNAAPSADKTLCRVEKADHNTIWRVGGDVPHACLKRFLTGLGGG